MRHKLKSEMKFDAGMENRTVCSCSDSPPPPDYGPMAQASEESARIAAELGREQIAESRRQYDLNRETIDPIIALQKQQMEETNRQGKDYYDYWVNNYRPIEGLAIQEALNSGTQQRQDEASARAIADSQGAYTRALNQAFRQSRRYGLQPQNMAGSQMLQQAQNTAAMAMGARENEKNIGYARKMDVAGLGRGLTGASQGAYGLALQGGNSAANNQMGLGQQLLTGMNQGAGTLMQGQGQRIQGLGSILNAQASYANANSGDGGLGGVLGFAGSMMAAPQGSFAASLLNSDRRLKESIASVGKDEATGLTIYEFTYKDDPEQRRYRGVMADEVEQVMPAAVVYDDLGFASVNYTMLGIEMVEV